MATADIDLVDEMATIARPLEELIEQIRWYFDHADDDPLELEYLASCLDDVVSYVNAAIYARPEVA